MSLLKIGTGAGVVGLAIATVVGLVQAQDVRESGLQITADEKRTLLSKDVGTERWAITRNADDMSVTGNVFFPSGGDPLFVFCEQTGTAGSDLLLDCFGADVCAGAPCGGDQWSALAAVTLPEAFFLPTPASTVELSEVFAAVAAAAQEAVESRAGGVRQSGLQVTPDGRRTVLSKDVGTERWAITRNADDNSVTGNVFFPSGGDPLFVFCNQTGTSGEDLLLECFGADVCLAAPCPGDQWSFLADVTLPESFFLPDGTTPSPTPAPTPAPTNGPLPTATPAPTPSDGGVCGNGIVEGAEECDGVDLNGESCDGLVSIFENCTSGALACNSDCTYDATSCVCPCVEDFDCFYEIDCDEAGDFCGFIEACDGSKCITTRIGSSEVCNGFDPGDPDPDFLRCD
ncbi:MAG: hypothetical protein P8R42_28670 [Candidatus Binatia bacterium]|nr:hypothetical protein [Candidatus Binatia bacterium]